MGYIPPRPEKKEESPPRPRGRSGAVRLAARHSPTVEELNQQLLENGTNVVVARRLLAISRKSLLPPDAPRARTRPAKRAPRSRASELPVIYRTEYRVPVVYAMVFFLLGVAAEWWHHAV